MSYVNLDNEGSEMINGLDNLVIVDVLTSLRGGTSLDVTGFAPNVIKAGHLIIKETATGNYKPMPVSGSGAITTLGSHSPGSGYANGVYPGVALTGGTGTGATANIVVSGGVVVSAVLVKKGTGYAIGDALSVAAANVGGTGTGFSVPVVNIDAVAASYAALPASHTYEGVLIASILTKKAFAGVMLSGTVNPNCAPFPMDTILAAVKAALPHIAFRTR